MKYKKMPLELKVYTHTFTRIKAQESVNWRDNLVNT